MWQDFQIVSLKLIAADLLLACPGYQANYSQSDGNLAHTWSLSREKVSSPGKMTKKAKTLFQDLYVPGEITSVPLQFRANVRLYSSPNNPGASQVATVIQEAMADLELSTAPPPMASHFLLYLSDGTFVGEAGERLAQEVRHMMRTDQPIVMLHENDVSNGGCVTQPPCLFARVGLLSHVWHRVHTDASLAASFRRELPSFEQRSAQHARPLITLVLRARTGRHKI